MIHARQISESIRLNSLLAISGGFMDAYSYIQRDHVFANAQTGNILLFGIHLSMGNLETARRYFLPCLAFAIGIALAEEIRIHLISKQTIHWRQLAVIIEAIILLLVGFMPYSANNLANTLTSFACGIQVQSFRKAHGNSLATTMCIGNMRSGVQYMGHYLHSKDSQDLRRSLIYFDMIGCFVIGAIIGSRVMKILGIHAIFISSALLTASFLIMFIDYEKKT